jgi:hypothetical protein
MQLGGELLVLEDGGDDFAQRLDKPGRIDHLLIKTGSHALNTAGSMIIDSAAFKSIEYS